MPSGPAVYRCMWTASWASASLGRKFIALLEGTRKVVLAELAVNNSAIITSRRSVGSFARHHSDERNRGLIKQNFTKRCEEGAQREEA